MTKRGLGLFGVAVVAVVAMAALTLDRQPQRAGPATIEVRLAGKPPAPTLYCEFYNFVGRAPKVGFTFVMETGASGTAFAQVNQLEMDGTRAEFGADAPRPTWSFDGSDSPATLTSPDGAIQINLYGYDRGKPGVTWFEAGLRSVQYLNLDGKCRQGAA